MPVMRLIRQLLVIFFLWFLPICKELRNDSFTVITRVLPAFQRCVQIYLLCILRWEITMRKLIAWSIKLSEKVHFGILLFYGIILTSIIHKSEFTPFFWILSHFTFDGFFQMMWDSHVRYCWNIENKMLFSFFKFKTWILKHNKLYENSLIHMFA